MPNANVTNHTSADQLHDAVGQHDLFGRAATALVDDERVAQHRDDERHDREPEPGVVAGVGGVLERPQAVRGDHHARRDGADVAEERGGVLAQRAPVLERVGAELDLLRVALAGDDEQRARAGDDEEPVGQLDAGGDAAGDGAEHEPRGDRGEVDHRLVLQPDRVRDGDEHVPGDDAGELEVVDRRGHDERQQDQHDRR